MRPVHTPGRRHFLPVKLVRPSPRHSPEQGAGVYFVSFFKPQHGPGSSQPDRPPLGILLVGTREPKVCARSGPRCALRCFFSACRFYLSPSRFPPFLVFFYSAFSFSRFCEWAAVSLFWREAPVSLTFVNQRRIL